MVLYSSTKGCRMKDVHEFFMNGLNEMLVTLNSLKLGQADQTLLLRLLPNSSLCLQSWVSATNDDDLQNKHPYITRTTQCPGCRFVKQSHEREKFRVHSTTKPVSLHAWVRKNATTAWIMCTSPWTHEIIAHVLLGDSPLLFAYVCNQHGISVYPSSAEPSSTTTEDPVNFTERLESWLDTLDALSGFLQAPVADLWDEHGKVSNLSTLTFSVPTNPHIRFVAPNTNDLPFTAQDAASPFETAGWRGNTLPDKKRKAWNEEVTLASLFFSPHFTEQVKAHPAWRWKEPPQDPTHALVALREKYNQY